MNELENVLGLDIERKKKFTESVALNKEGIENGKIKVKIPFVSSLILTLYLLNRCL